MKLSMRPVDPSDEEFLFELYRSTRVEEISAWGWSPDQQEAFLRMQFTAQKRSYGMAYGSAEHDLIVAEGDRIGRMMVSRNDAEINLVDIALLPEARGKGVGSDLIRKLQREAELCRKTVVLQVANNNRARHLYERLGFVLVSDDAMYCRMKWSATRTGEFGEKEPTNA